MSDIKMTVDSFEDKVAMAMTVIPRAGIESIKVGNQQIPVSANNSYLNLE